MADVRPPGVYEEKAESRHTPIRLAPTGIPVFIGVARRGPVDVATKLRSPDQFAALYGDPLEGAYLAAAVTGFFANGGRECYVMRVAHREGRGPGRVARAASVTLPDIGGRPRVSIRAADEGAWGNALRVSLEHLEPRARTFLTLDAAKGACEATVRSTHALTAGTTIRLADDEGEVYRTLVAVQGRTLRWKSTEPLERRFSSGGPSYVTPVELALEVEGDGRSERFAPLSMGPNSQVFLPRVIAAGSRLIRVEVVPDDTSEPTTLPSEAARVALGGGEDGLDDLSPEDFIGADEGPGARYGLAALAEIEDADILLVPDLAWCLERSRGFRSAADVEAVQHALVDDCERHEGRMVLLDPPRDIHVRGVLDWRRMFDSAHAAAYFPWLCVADEAGAWRTVPPCGHVAGVYARSDATHGVFRAPANEELEGVVDVALLLHENDVSRLNETGVNCLCPFTARGVRVWGARTLSSDSALRYVNVRRNLDAIIRSLRTDLQWVVFEPNTASLWQTISRNASFFLEGLWRSGFFRGRSAQEAYYVKCDGETNPPATRDAGQVIVEVGVAPVRPAEFIAFRIEQAMPESKGEPGAE